MLSKFGMVIVDKVWYSKGIIPAVIRTLLLPLEGAYAVTAAIRSKLYDTGVLNTEQPALPCISIGNLTAGGSGKTPVAAWFATQLTQRGACPAIVMRGYGSDEILVHERLNPKVPVIADPDRAKGVREAVAQGADTVVLDDAFQHRAVIRSEDIVLINADRWEGINKGINSRQRLLPAGPWREPLSALHRASLVIITTKMADPLRISGLEEVVRTIAPALKVAVMFLLPDELALTTGNEFKPIKALDGTRAFAVTSIADPASFHGQLADAGANVTGWAFADHYDFTDKDAEEIAAEARKYDIAVCTLKDAVKLGPLWPAVAPKLWYVKQRVEVESGEEHVNEVLDRITDRKLRLV